MEVPGDLEPVSRESTASIIADRLRDAIMYGSLPPGTQMAESDLAARLGVSRGPLREAMQRLVQEGLLVSARHRGLFVITLEADDVRDIYAARSAVERAACTLILDRDRGAAADHLDRIVRRMAVAARKADPRALSDADQDFHETLVAESGSPRLVRMARTLLVETRMCMNALEGTYRAPDDLVDEHQSIVGAIREGNEKRLLAKIDAHMQDALERLTPPAEALSQTS